jgi:hypothetical protein
MSDSNPKYAVVEWFNYRKELHAGHLKNFESYNEAAEYAFKRAQKDKEGWQNDGPVITEDEITNGDGPGKDGSPYANYTLVGYGGRNSTGYCTTFYCVVPWFEGVENSWDEFGDDDDESNDDEWVPKYSY